MKSRLWTVIVVLLSLGAGLCSCRGETEVREGDTAWNESVQPFRKTMDMGGYALSYIDMGAGSPVVLVHGFADSTYAWHKVAFALRDAGNRLIIVDQPGHGLSDTPPAPWTYTIENQAGAVAKLVDRLGLEDYTLVGHCMGGSIALYLAEKNPDRIRRLALLAPVCYKPPAIQLLKLPGMEFLATRLGGPFAFRMGLEDAFYDSDRVTETMVNEYYRPMSRPGYLKTLIRIEKEFYSPEFLATSAGLSKILRPVLLIWGKEDTWVTEDQGRRIAGDLSNADLHILDKCGHYPQLESVRSVTPLLVNFLRDATPRVDPLLIRPGEGIGDIILGMSRDEVKKFAGKPLSIRKSGDQFEGFIVRYQNDRVAEILVTSPSYRTREGITTSRPVERFLAAYPDAETVCYEARSGGHVAHGRMRDARAQGIAYDWNAFEGKRLEQTVTINIHAPGVPAHVYGTVAPCRAQAPGRN